MGGGLEHCMPTKINRKFRKSIKKGVCGGGRGSHKSLFKMPREKFGGEELPGGGTDPL